MENTFSAAGHFFIGLYFAFFSIWNIYHWRPLIQTLVQENIAHSQLLLMLGIGWQFLAGIFIMSGILVKLTALLLIPSTIIVMCMFHPFWRFQGEQRRLNFSIFATNMTVTIGGLLLL